MTNPRITWISLKDIKLNRVLPPLGRGIETQLKLWSILESKAEKDG